MRRVLFLVLAFCAALVAVASSGAVVAQEATPGGGATPVGEAPPPEECPVDQAAVVERLAALAATPVAAQPTPTPVDPASFVPPAGEPADEETVAAITATARAFIACINGGSQIAALGLFTDAGIRSLVGANLEQFRNPAVIAAITAQVPVPLAENEQTLFLGVREVAVLPDGRVGAHVDGDDLRNPEPGGDVYFLFVETDDGYLIDEVIDLQPDDAATPSP